MNCLACGYGPLVQNPVHSHWFHCPICESALARVEELERLADEYAHLRSEWEYGRDRGDHLVYRHEWEAFDAWQRGERAALVARVEELERDVADAEREAADFEASQAALLTRMEELQAALQQIADGREVGKALRAPRMRVIAAAALSGQGDTTRPWAEPPDPRDFGGRLYSDNERKLGYGTDRDPRFLPPGDAPEGDTP